MSTKGDDCVKYIFFTSMAVFALLLFSYGCGALHPFETSKRAPEAARPEVAIEMSGEPETDEGDENGDTERPSESEIGAATTVEAEASIAGESGDGRQSAPEVTKPSPPPLAEYSDEECWSSPPPDAKTFEFTRFDSIQLGIESVVSSEEDEYAEIYVPNIEDGMSGDDLIAEYEAAIQLPARDTLRMVPIICEPARPARGAVVTFQEAGGAAWIGEMFEAFGYSRSAHEYEFQLPPVEEQPGVWVVRFETRDIVVPYDDCATTAECETVEEKTRAWIVVRRPKAGDHPEGRIVVESVVNEVTNDDAKTKHVSREDHRIALEPGGIMVDGRLWRW